MALEICNKSLLEQAIHVWMRRQFEAILDEVEAGGPIETYTDQEGQAGGLQLRMLGEDE